MLSRVKAIATTVNIDPGSETTGSEGMRIRKRIFTDRVQSVHPSFDGTNRVVLDLDIDPQGGGVLHGTFELTLTSGTGTWKGEVDGHFEEGMVVAEGMARGTGMHDGAVLYISYRQIKEHPGKPPIENPLAVFDMNGVVLSPR